MKMTDILIPKSEEEIMKKINLISTNKLLEKSIAAQFMPGVEIAIKKGTIINNTHGYSSYLNQAIMLGNLQIVKILLKNNAKPSGFSIAAALDFPEILKFIIDQIEPSAYMIKTFKSILNGFIKEKQEESEILIREKLESFRKYKIC